MSIFMDMVGAVFGASQRLMFACLRRIRNAKHRIKAVQYVRRHRTTCTFFSRRGGAIMFCRCGGLGF